MEHNLREKLSAPFDDSDIEWRLQHSNEEKGFGVAVPYVTNRAIQNRLDKSVGIGNWKNEFIPWQGDGKKTAQLCGISIYFAERNEWITKYDGAENSDIEPVKGGLSDSMKRAAVQWGIGRYLYEMDTVFVDIEKSGKSTVIKESSKAKLNAAHQRVAKRLFQPVPQTPKSPGTAPTVDKAASKPTPMDKSVAQQPVPMDSKSAKQPTSTDSRASQQPVPMDIRAAQQPATMDSSAVQQPVPMDSKTVRQTESATGYPVANSMEQMQQPSPGSSPTPQPSITAKNTYQIIDSVKQPSVRGVNTNLRLQGNDGVVVMAFMQGEHPALIKGARIENAVITRKTKEGIVFYTLDSFTAPTTCAA